MTTDTKKSAAKPLSGWHRIVIDDLIVRYTDVRFAKGVPTALRTTRTDVSFGKDALNDVFEFCGVRVEVDADDWSFYNVRARGGFKTDWARANLLVVAARVAS